jgi:DNA-binding Lrp family transcriptional regulator
MERALCLSYAGPTMANRLDATDLRILKELQTNGRMTNVDLAERAGITPPPCLRRVRALEIAGYIEGYNARLSADLLGFEVTAFAAVQLFSQAETDLGAFERLVDTLPAVRECYQVSGETDYQLKCIAPDMKAFQALVAQLTSAPNVRSVRTMIAIKPTKVEPGLPLVLGRPK